MVHKFTANPETAHQLTKLSKKHGFYFKSLTRTTNIEKVVCEVTATGYDFINDNGIEVDFYTYDVVFNNDTDSNSKGFKSSVEDCKKYIELNNGSNDSYFADYKGGIVSVVCNETGETVYSEEIR